MNCPRISRNGRPAYWLHSLCCPECRNAKRADDLLAYGIVQLRNHANSHAALNRTLAALALPTVAEDYSRLLQRRSRTRMRIATGAALFLCVAGWFRYMDWTPAEPSTTFSQQTSPAFLTLMRTAPPTPKPEERNRRTAQITAIASAARKLIEQPESASISDVTSVGRFVSENKRCLDAIHANLLRPYRQHLHRTPSDLDYDDFFPLYSITTTLQTEAAWKASHGDRADTIDAALDLIAFGENLAGGGSWTARNYGEGCQREGRLLLWRFVSDMSAAEARHALVRLEEAHRLHSPITTTVRRQHEEIVHEKRQMLMVPFWRSRSSYRFIRMNTLSGEMPSEIGVTLSLYTRSNRRILQELDETLEAAEQQFKQPFVPSTATMYQAEDSIDQELRPDESNIYRVRRYLDLANETQNALLTTTVAIRAYHQGYGVDPPTLQALCPQYLEQVPADPFHPRSPFHYGPLKSNFRSFVGASTTVQGKSMSLGWHGSPQATKSRRVSSTVGPKDSLGSPISTLPYLLYSTGPDGIDQHGAFVELEPPARVNSTSRDKFRVQEASEGDIVAGINL